MILLYFFQILNLVWLPCKVAKISFKPNTLSTLDIFISNFCFYCRLYFKISGTTVEIVLLLNLVAVRCVIISTDGVLSHPKPILKWTGYVRTTLFFCYYFINVVYRRAYGSPKVKWSQTWGPAGTNRFDVFSPFDNRWR